MTKQQSAERDEAIATLRATLKPGDTVYTILRHVSRSGMQRTISVVTVRKEDEPYPDRHRSYNVAVACGYPFDRDRQGVKVSGCGEDKGFALIYDLARTLYPYGFGCIGEGCPSNEHSNGDRDYTPHNPEGARVITYVDRTDPEPRTSRTVVGVWGDYNPQGHRTLNVVAGPSLYIFDDEVLSDEPAPQHWHTDGGYSLRQRWL